MYKGPKRKFKKKEDSKKRKKISKYGGQLVSHAHIIVNGKTIKSGSYNVIVSDKVSIKKSKIDLFPYRHLKTKLIKKIPPIWLKYISPDKMSAEMINNIEFEDFKEPINLSLVIEFYSR